MPKTKAGEKITWGEFLKRWKKGIALVTPQQMTWNTIIGLGISTVGIVWGIVYSIILNLWWLLIILSGALMVTSMQLLGNLQKYMAMKKMEAMING